MTFLPNKGLFFLFIFLIASNVLAQKALTGKVLGIKKEPIPGASITINHSNKIIAFGFSGRDGTYKIMYNSDVDTVQVSVSLLGYANLKRKILNQTQQINFEMEEAVLELREIKVKPDPISKKGDTLSYSVGVFKGKEDRVIGDVIKKLPGIDIGPNGQLLYQGTPINKYYIEGLDLLGGRYNLANENLNVASVTSIEIIENHQPIRMLDTLVVSDRAALNIRLKKNVITTGQAFIGTGLKPFLRDANITPMVFTPSYQTLGTLQSNNTGQNLSNQLLSLTTDSYGSDFTTKLKTDWLAIQQLGKPAFRDVRWLDNNASLGSLNVLKKLSDGLEMRFQIDYLHDNQRQIGYTKTLFFTTNSGVQFLENKQNQLFFRNLNSDLTLQKNTKGRFFRNTLRTEVSWDRQTGNILNNSSPLIQQLQIPYLIISNNYQNIIKLHQNLLTFRSNISVERTPQTLLINQNPFDYLLDTTSNILQQNVLQKGVKTENSIQLTKSQGFFSWDFKVGFHLQKQTLETTISVSENPPVAILNKDFRNDLNWVGQKYYLSVQHRFRKRNLSLVLNSPVSWYSFDARDREFNKATSLNKFLVEPTFVLNYNLNDFWKANLSSEIKYSFGTIDQVYFGYILTNYRNIQRNNSPILQSKIYPQIVGLNYRNPITSIFGGISYSYFMKVNNLLFDNFVGTSGTLERRTINQNNSVHAQNLGGRLGKYFGKIKTTITAFANFRTNSQIQMINDTLVNTLLKSITPSVKITSNLTNWFSLDGYFQYSRLQNSIAGDSQKPIKMHSYEVKLNFFPTPKSYFGFKNELYLNRFNNQTNLFMDLIFRQTFTKPKFDLEFFWTNILNTKSLISVINGDFSYVETSYQLRPMQGIIKGRFSF